MDTLKHKTARGFTLIELMTVICIMAIMMAVSIGAFLDYGRGSSMRGSALNVHSSLNLARQWAITHRQRTTFAYGNNTEGSRGWYTMNTNNVQIGPITYLAEGIVFSNQSTSVHTISFTYDGSCTNQDGGITEFDVALSEKFRDEPLVQFIEVMPLTGRCRIRQPVFENSDDDTRPGSL